MKKAKKITKKRFIAATGREPVLDDLERANCPMAGEMGHWSCGWCEEHDKPKFMCNRQLQRQVRERIIVVNVDPAMLSFPNSRPAPKGSKPPRPLNEVELEIVRADIAYLKQQEIDSGDWAKWQESQKNWNGFDGPQATEAAAHHMTHIIGCMKITNVEHGPHVPSRLDFCHKCGFPIHVALSTPVFEDGIYMCLECVEWAKVEEVMQPTPEQIADVRRARNERG